MEDKNPAATVFGFRMRHARDAARLTQKDLARVLDVRENDIRRWETGRNLPKSERLPDIAAALDVSIDWMFGVGPEGPKPDDEQPV